MNRKEAEVLQVVPSVVVVAAGIVLLWKINALKAKQDEIVAEIEELKKSISGEALVNAILAATADKKKDKKGKKDRKGKKDKKGNKDKKKKK
jgi:hypothetical protein